LLLIGVGGFKITRGVGEGGGNKQLYKSVAAVKAAPVNPADATRKFVKLKFGLSNISASSLKVGPEGDIADAAPEPEFVEAWAVEA
jgi:hypothetical protein